MPCVSLRLGLGPWILQVLINSLFFDRTGSNWAWRPNLTGLEVGAHDGAQKRVEIVGST